MGPDADPSSLHSHPHPTPLPSREREQGEGGGFLLLETLLTVLILTAGLTIVVRSFGSSFDALRTSRDYTTALLLLDQRMGELEAHGSVTPGAETGRFSEDAGGFEWQVKIAEPDLVGLCEALVTVSWRQQGRPRAVSLVTYLTPETPRER